MSLSLLKTGGMLALTVMGLFGGTGNAQTLEHLDRLAVQLQRQTRDLHREIDTHARNAPRFGELEREVKDIERMAAHIHDLIEKRGNPTHVRAEVRKLDRLVHHVDDNLRAILRSGRVSGKGASDIRRAMELVERTAHQMENHRD